VFSGYLTPKQQALFGTIPSRNLLDTDDSAVSSRASSPPRSDQMPISLPTLSAIISHPPSINYLKTLQRAIHKRDGPLFVKTLLAINALLRWLKYPPLSDDPFAPTPVNVINESVKSWTPTGMPTQVSMRIIEETYQRCVGPQVHELQRYEAFSSEVYGELMPSLISEIIRVTGLNKESILMDLGSGVGNVVLQASLQTGCTSYGIEIMPAPAKIARTQLEQLKIRCKMWGVSMGEVQLEQGDMLVSDTVTQMMGKADVVLINNKVFLESCELFGFDLAIGGANTLSSERVPPSKIP
jgi:[histone H3]-lysine79 N-trimethyltransferase